MIKQQEQEALDRIRESLEEFPDSRMAQYVTAEDLKTLLKLVDKMTHIEKEHTSWGN